MTKILFTGAPLSGNKGATAMAVSTAKTLSNFLPDTEFTLTTHLNIEECSKWGRVYGINVVAESGIGIRNSFSRCLLWKVLSKFGLNIQQLLNDPIIKEYLDADVIVDIGGITFTDFYNEEAVIHTARHLMGKILNKPVIKYMQDMGPFNKKINRYCAKFCLPELDLIIVRGELSRKYLQELDINKLIYVLPDSAFPLEPAPKEKIDDIFLKEKITGKPLIGMCVSSVIDRVLCGENIELKNRYTTIMAQIADYLIEKLNAFIVFIPHDIRPREEYDDAYVANKVYREMKNKSRVKVIDFDYSVEEFKGIIGRCDLFVGSRYHSIIASVSMCVPTLIVGWEHKYYEVMELVDQEKFVTDYQTFTFDELREKVDDLWQNKEKIREEMKARIPDIKKSAVSGGELVKECVVNKRNGGEYSIYKLMQCIGLCIFSYWLILRGPPKKLLRMITRKIGGTK